MDNYENRIRAFSSPEKVFGMFASVESDGELFMTSDDFFRAMTPHAGNHDPKNPGSGTATLKTSANSIFKLIDANGDGLLSFQEYIFFVTILSLPEHLFRIAFDMFDRDASGKIDRSEFLQMMQAMMSKSPQASQVRAGAVSRSSATLRK